MNLPHLTSPKKRYHYIMPSAGDKDASKAARHLFGKRGIDVNQCDVRVVHGICYVKGVVAPIAGFEIEDIRGAMEQAAMLLRRRPEIRDVSIDVAYRGAK